MSDSFYLTFTSEDTLNTYPDNTACHFRFKLNKPMILQRGKWKVSRLNFYHKKLRQHKMELFVCMTGIKESVVGDNRTLPMLQRYPLMTQNPTAHVLEQPVVQEYFECVEIYIRARQEVIEVLNTEKTICTLHFTQKSLHGDP